FAFHSFRIRTTDNFYSFQLQQLPNFIAYVDILLLQNAISKIQNGNLRAEAPVHLTELQGNIPSTDDQKVAGYFLQLHQSSRSKISTVFQTPDVGQILFRACADNNLRSSYKGCAS